MKFTFPIAATLAAVMAVGSLGSTSAVAAPPHAKLPAVQSDNGVVQVASKKKHRRVHRGDAAAAGAMIGLFGAIAGMAAQDSYRDRYYYDDGYYYGGPGPVYNGRRYSRHHSGRHYGGPGPFNGGTSVYTHPHNMPGSNVSPPER